MRHEHAIVTPYVEVRGDVATREIHSSRREIYFHALAKSSEVQGKLYYSRAVTR